MTTPTTFLAVELPTATVRAVRERLGSLPEERDAAWTRPEGWHVTLAWLDRLDDRAAGLVAVQASRVLSEVLVGGQPRPHGHDLGRAELGPVVRLGRAVALHVAAPARLVALRARLVEVLSTAQADLLSERAVASLDRAWRPHVTVARARRGDSPAALRRAVAARWTGPVAWRPRTMALLASRTGDGPAHYATREGWALHT